MTKGSFTEEAARRIWAATLKVERLLHGPSLRGQPTPPRFVGMSGLKVEWGKTVGYADGVGGGPASSGGVTINPEVILTPVTDCFGSAETGQPNVTARFWRSITGAGGNYGGHADYILTTPGEIFPFVRTHTESGTQYCVIVGNPTLSLHWGRVLSDWASGDDITLRIGYCQNESTFADVYPARDVVCRIRMGPTPSGVTFAAGDWLPFMFVPNSSIGTYRGILIGHYVTG